MRPLYRSGRWGGIGTHSVWNGALHPCSHGNPLSLHWSTGIHRSRVTTYRRKRRQFCARVSHSVSVLGKGKKEEHR